MTSGPAPSSHYALSGLRVVEIAEGVAGPYCARLLGDAGAAVVKIEGPNGDPARQRATLHRRVRVAGRRRALRLPEQREAVGRHGRRKARRDRAAFRELLSTTDVLVHDSLDPSESLAGMNPEQLLQEFPQLVTVSLTPFGESGPYVSLLADDLVLAGMGGLLAVSPGFPDHVISENEPPLRANAHIAELIGGAFGAIGGLVALSARDITGCRRLRRGVAA